MTQSPFSDNCRYQFNPDLVPLASDSPATPTEAVHDSITLKILLLSIAHRPFDSDFSLALALCGDRMVRRALFHPPDPALTHPFDLQSELVTPQDTLAAFANLSQLSFLLQSRQFAAFWQLLRSDALSILHPFVAEVAEFDELIRASIGNSVEGCFRSISRRRLETYLGMEVEDRDLEDWIDQRGWSSDGDQVSIPPNSENSPVATVIRERTTLEGALCFSLCSWKPLLTKRPADVHKILVKSVA